MHSSYFQEFDQLLHQDDTKLLIDELAAAPAERLSVLYNKLAVHIFHVNEENQSIDDVCQQAEKFRPVVHYAVEQLLQLYMQQGELISRQNEAVASACRRLLNVQYKAYMAQLDYARKNSKKQDLLETAIHRIIVIQLYLHIISYIMYSAIAEKEWLNLHRLFIIARHNKLTDFTIEDEDCYVKNPVSIGELYSLSLLMGCASLHQLTVPSIIKAVSCVYELANLVTISDKPQGVENELLFDISSGSAPNFRKFVTETSQSVFYYLHLEKLLDTIKKHRTEGDSLFNNADFPEELKSHLIEAWSRYQVREDRVVVDKTLQATIGFDNIHYYLCGGRELKDFLGLGFDRSIVYEDESTIAVIDGQYGENTGQADIPVPANHPNEENVKEAYSFQRYFEMNDDAISGSHPVFNIKMVDQSVGGCCLELQSDVHANIAIGVLIGFRDATVSSHWQIGEVVWFRIIDENIAHAGVRILSTEAIPLGVDVSFNLDANKNYAEGILLPYESSLKHLTSIILPEDLYDEGTFLKVVQKGLVNDLKLTNNILRSEFFTQFNCGFYKPEPEEEMADR